MALTAHLFNRMRTARGRRIALVAGAVALTASSIPLALRLGYAADSPLAHGATSLASIFNNRSPGQRTAAELTKTKHKKLARVVPHERALPKVRPPEMPPEFLAALMSPPAPDFSDVAPLMPAA